MLLGSVPARGGGTVGQLLPVDRLRQTSETECSLALDAWSSPALADTLSLPKQFKYIMVFERVSLY
jgi:hypothetical protein